MPRPILFQLLPYTLVLMGVLLAACAPATTTTAAGAAAISPRCSGSEQAVRIADPALRSAIVRTLPHLDHDARPDCGDLAQLRELAARGVSRLDGIEYAVNLATLTLRDSSLTSLAPLSGMTRLRTLTIAGGDLNSIDWRAGPSGLSRLEITGNALSDLRGLPQARQLSFVTLSRNSLSDISALSELEELYWLDLNDNLVSDLAPLAGSSKLSILKLNDNQVVDSSPLAGLTSLSWVEIANNGLTDMAFVSQLRLERLDLSGNSIESITPLARSLRLRDDGRYDLRGNCIDLASDDPFQQDLLSRDIDLRLESQAACEPA